MSPAKSSGTNSMTFKVVTGRAKPPPPRFRVRRRHVMRAVAVVFALGTMSFFGCEPAYQGSLVVRAPRPLIVAHRGFGDRGPDNSLYAVEHALDVDVDGVDVDGQLTRDGELVIFPDLTVDRLTSGSGRVGDKTLKEMLALDLGPKYNRTIQGAYVRTFEDFVRAVKGRGILMVELKVPGMEPTGIEERAVRVIEKYDAHLSVVLSSSNPLVLYRIKSLDQFVRTAFVFGAPDNPPWPLRLEFVRRAVRKIVKPDLLAMDGVDEAVIDRLIEKGWPVLLGTPLSDNDIRQALSKQPYGVISDHPIRALQLRGE
jgi:glycerophosphoryl diester phosphodiesterase